MAPSKIKLSEIRKSFEPKNSILMILKTRRSSLLDKGKFGRAEILKEIIDNVESGKIIDYSMLENVGLEVSPPLAKGYLIIK